MQVVSVRLHYFLVSPNIIWLLWQRPLTNRKIRYIICIQSAFMWWKDCENRFSISGDIRLNMTVFCHVVPEGHKWTLSTLELLDQSAQNFYTHRRITYAVNRHTEVAITHSVSKCQSDEWGKFVIFLQNWLLWQRPLRYQKRGPDRSSAPKTLSFSEKFVKIGPVDLEIIVLREIIKKRKKLEMRGKA